MRGTLRARPTVAVAGGSKLANKQASRPAAPAMLGSSAARTAPSAGDAAAAASNVKVAAIKPPASPAQTYANDEAPLKLSIGEAPGMGESSDSLVEMRGARVRAEMSVLKSSLEPFDSRERNCSLQQHETFHVSSIVIPSFPLRSTLSFAVRGLALPLFFPRCAIWGDILKEGLAWRDSGAIGAAL